MTAQEPPADPAKTLVQPLDVGFARQAAGLGVWEVDPPTNQVIWDDRCRQLFGLAADNKLPYEQAIQYIHPKDQDRVNQAVQWALDPLSRGVYDQTYRTLGADDGQLRWVRFSGQGYFDETGKVMRFAGVAQDVTLPMAAQQSHQQTLALFKQAPVGIATLSVDEALVFQFVNPFYSELVGRTPGDLLDKPLLEALPELRGQGFAQILREVIATGTPFRANEQKVQLARAGQLETIYVNYTYQPQRSADGLVSGVLAVVIDVTTQVLARRQIEASDTRYRALSTDLEEQVQQRTQDLAATNQELLASNEQYAVLNRELNEANSLLARSNQNLQTFAYVASHDLQEPLRKIQQFGDLLTIRYADSVGEELVYLERMQSAASRMSTLIKDLLDFSRISTQRDTSGPVSLADVVGRVLSILDLTIQETGAQVSVAPLPTVMGDASQLNQLFQNLLSNALKFHRTDRTGVPVVPTIAVKSSWLAAEHLPKDLNLSWGALAYHRIDVVDNGIGFEEKYLDRIFQVFQRLHGKHDYAGTGIGLAICEKVATNHGGAITASSQPGQGATFTIYLPA